MDEDVPNPVVIFPNVVVVTIPGRQENMFNRFFTDIHRRK
jgi:hypothetical protein